MLLVVVFPPCATTHGSHKIALYLSTSARNEDCPHPPTFLQRRRSSPCNDTDTCKVLKIPIEYGGNTESDKTACGWEKSSASQWFLGLELVYWWWSSSPMRHHSDPVLYALLLLRSSPPRRRRRAAAVSGTRPPGLTLGEPASFSPSSS